VKLFSHWVQAYGFSPVWTRSCDFRCAGWVNLLSQYEHL